MIIETHSILSPAMEKLQYNYTEGMLAGLKRYLGSTVSKTYSSYELLYGSLISKAKDYLARLSSECSRIDAILDFCVALDSVYLEKGIGASAYRRCVVWDILFRLKPYLTESESRNLIDSISNIDKHIFTLDDENEKALERQRFILTVFTTLSTQCRHPVQNRLALNYYVSCMNTES